jgi:hypothetical protein
MKKMAVFFAGAALLVAAGEKKTLTGIITDEMCGKDHKAMNMGTDPKCVTECVKGMGSKYVLVSGSDVYVLSDQKTPEKFAGKKVTVSGTVDGKNIQVSSIAAAK